MDSCTRMEAAFEYAELKKENEILVCSITDNGIGRKKSAELKSTLSVNKKSLGMNITASRLHLLNEGIGNQIGLQIIDLMDSLGQSAGTRVVITIPIKKTRNFFVSGII